MPEWTVDKAARELLDCADNRTTRPPLSESWPGLSVESAYRIQDEILRLRLARGESLIGVKLGLTSIAKQQQANVSAPLSGFLTDAMILPAGQPIPSNRLIQPRVEAEIAFVLGRDIGGPEVNPTTALAAVDYVMAAFDVVDSRYPDYRFTLPDVIADNACTGRLVTGSVKRTPNGWDIALETCTLTVNGATHRTATGAAVLGHPANAVAAAARVLHRRGLGMKAGWTILTGALMDAEPLNVETTITAAFGSLGKLTVGSEPDS